MIGFELTHAPPLAGRKKTPKSTIFSRTQDKKSSPPVASPVCLLDSLEANPEILVTIVCILHASMEEASSNAPRTPHLNSIISDRHASTGVVVVVFSCDAVGRFSQSPLSCQAHCAAVPPSFSSFLRKRKGVFGRSTRRGSERRENEGERGLSKSNRKWEETEGKKTKWWCGAR